MRLGVFAMLWVVAAVAGPPLSESQSRRLVSVLAPMSYGASCWSVAEIQNLGSRQVIVEVEGHKGSGALVALGGASGVAMRVESDEKIQLQLQVPGEESLEGWLKITEVLPDSARGPALAVSGRTECVLNDQLVTSPQSVAYPMRDPWLAFDLAESPGRVAMVLNLAAEAATAKICYSKGTRVSVAEEHGNGAKLVPVCSESRLLQIPPFASASVAVEYDGNSQFSLEAQGESLVLRVLLPPKPGLRTYTVDSTIQFGQMLDGKP